MNIIRYNNIQKSYGSKIILNNQNFSIGMGETVALIGNNGCGKTTTINILCNLTTYNSGEYIYKDKKVTPNYVSFKKELGVVLSTPYYVEEFNTLEYWRFVCKFQEVPKAEIENRITDLLQLLELTEHSSKPIRDLSSGNKMKVSIGAALIHNPEVLVLDEPFVNLDINTVETVMSILKGFKGKKTIFITSHQLDLVADLCDKFLIMDKGQITAELHKKDYTSLQDLQNKVKEFLVTDTTQKQLDWLK